MSPTPKATILFIPALLFVRLALWTTMTINTVNIITIGLIIARGHASDFAEICFLLSTEVIVVIMATIKIGAGVGTLQVKNVAELQFLDSLDLFAWNCWVKFVNALSQPIPIDPWDRLRNSWLDRQ